MPSEPHCASTRGTIPCSEITRENSLEPIPGLMEDPISKTNFEKAYVRPWPDPSNVSPSTEEPNYAKGGSVGRPYAANGYAKGGYVYDNPDRPRGGPPRTERSQFLKTPDVFRTSIEEQDYGKKQADAPVKTKSDTKQFRPRT